MLLIFGAWALLDAGFLAGWLLFAWWARRQRARRTRVVDTIRASFTEARHG